VMCSLVDQHSMWICCLHPQGGP